MKSVAGPWSVFLSVLAVAAVCAATISGDRPALAQTSKPQPGHPIKVATRIVPPFAMEENGKLTGFSIDLWNAIARELGTQTQYVVRPSVSELLKSVHTGESQAGIAAVSITSEREEQFDFSQPMFDSGLQILVRAKGGSSGGFLSLVGQLVSPAFLQLLGLMLLLVVVLSHLVWFFERGLENGFLENRRYFPGIFEAAWWAVATLATQADSMPRSALGRITAIFWMFTSVVFVAYFTATVTTQQTVQQLQGIKGPEDLPGHLVGSITGSTASAYLKEKGLTQKTYATVGDAAAAMSKGEVDAVVFDAPVLLYYAANDGKGKAQVVGPLFRKEAYGIVIPNGSPLRKRINTALLKLREDGTYEQLYTKWFE